MTSTKRLGELGERIAELFLVLKGYEVLRRNFRYAGREIDLIVRRDSTIAAVEVKLRTGSNFGRATESVDRRKLVRIRTALEVALIGLPDSVKPRIDVVAIDIAGDQSEMVVRHIEAVY